MKQFVIPFLNPQIVNLCMNWENIKMFNIFQLGSACVIIAWHLDDNSKIASNWFYKLDAFACQIKANFISRNLPLERLKQKKKPLFLITLLWSDIPCPISYSQYFIFCIFAWVFPFDQFLSSFIKGKGKKNHALRLGSQILKGIFSDPFPIHSLY
jgi:hypothetical protein